MKPRKPKRSKRHMQEYELKTVPNQRTIYITKEPCNSDKLYTNITIEAINKAAGQIKSIGGIKLYLYFARHQSGYKFALSRSHFLEWAGVSENAYKSGFKELINLGYLIPTKNKKQESRTDHIACYVFIDKPKSEQKAAEAAQSTETAENKKPTKEQQKFLDTHEGYAWDYKKGDFINLRNYK